MYWSSTWVPCTEVRSGSCIGLPCGSFVRGEVWVMYWSSMWVLCTGVRSGSCIGLPQGSLVQG